MSYPNYIISHLYRNDLVDAEKSAGYEMSSILVEKISDTKFVWPIKTSDIVESSYPKTEDGFNPKCMTVLD
jgi:hypothetical protein